MILAGALGIFPNTTSSKGDSTMSIKTHLDALNVKHAELENKLHEAYIHHQPIELIKKEKLKVKDEILSFEKRLKTNEAVAA